MNVGIREMESGIYAINPQIEKISGVNRMRITTAGCSHVLLIRVPLDTKLDLTDSSVWNMLTNLDEELLLGKETQLADGRMTVKCIDYMTLNLEHNCIQLPEIAGNYAVCGCRYDKQKKRLDLYLPGNRKISYQTTVSIEIKYTVLAHMITEKAGLFKSRERASGYYEVRIGTKTSPFSTGDIVYRVEGQPYDYPVPRELRGERFFVKSQAMPEFSAVHGIRLIKE